MKTLWVRRKSNTFLFRSV